jgi:hypothetical protein
MQPNSKFHPGVPASDCRRNGAVNGPRHASCANLPIIKRLVGMTDDEDREPGLKGDPRLKSKSRNNFCCNSLVPAEPAGRAWLLRD